MVMIEYVLSPNHGDVRITTDGVVVHSTRGGSDYEYEATISWFGNPTSQVSAHRIINNNGDMAVVVPDDYIAWHAKSYNSSWLGVELTQSTANSLYTEEHYLTLAKLLREWSYIYNFPLDRDHVVGHSEIDLQKSDPGVLFDWDKLFRYINMENDMQSIIESLVIIWNKLDQIQSYTTDPHLIELAEEAKQQGVVEIKKAIGLE